MREYAKILRDCVESGTSEDDIRSTLNQQMSEIYKVVGICLGIPEERFKWEYYDKSKAYQCVGPIKPIEFYWKYVKQCFNVDDKVSNFERVFLIYSVGFNSHFSSVRYVS